MRLKIILETITAFVCGAQAIVGGIAASNEDLPFIVSVARTSHQCSGVLISPSAVLTDPECVEQGRVTSLKVRAGTRRHASGGVLEQVSKIDIHQDYVSGTLKGPHRNPPPGGSCPGEFRRPQNSGSASPFARDKFRHKARCWRMGVDESRIW